MRSMIYGAGSLGTILGATLAERGADVLLVSRNAAHIEALRTKGAAITGSISGKSSSLRCWRRLYRKTVYK